MNGRLSADECRNRRMGCTCVSPMTGDLVRFRAPNSGLPGSSRRSTIKFWPEAKHGFEYTKAVRRGVRSSSTLSANGDHRGGPLRSTAYQITGCRTDRVSNDSRVSNLNSSQESARFIKNPFQTACLEVACTARRGFANV